MKAAAKTPKWPRMDRSGHIPGTIWFVGGMARTSFTAKEMEAVSRWTREAARWLRHHERRRK